MNKCSTLNPFDVPKVLRHYLYDRVVLAWETNQCLIVSAAFSKKKLNELINIRVEMVRKLSEVERRSKDPWGPDEFIIFYGEGKGYESLFKRLRDAIAHGHYGLDKRGWITIWHQYKGRSDKIETTRLFARLRQPKLKKLIYFIDRSSFSESEIDGFD